MLWDINKQGPILIQIICFTQCAFEVLCCWHSRNPSWEQVQIRIQTSALPYRVFL